MNSYEHTKIPIPTASCLKRLILIEHGKDFGRIKKLNLLPYCRDFQDLRRKRRIGLRLGKGNSLLIYLMLHVNYNCKYRLPRNGGNRGTMVFRHDAVFNIYFYYAFSKAV